MTINTKLAEFSVWLGDTIQAIEGSVATALANSASALASATAALAAATSLKDSGHTPIDFGLFKDSFSATERYTLTKQGTGSNNVIQSAAEVPEDDALYTLHVTGSPELAVVNKFRAEGARVQTSDRWIKTPTNLIGHQGLGVERSEDGLWFWSSANEAETDAENKVVRYQLVDDPADDDNLLVANAEVYKLWPGSNGSGNSTPCISFDGRFLVTELKVSDTENLIRVFNLNELSGTPGDYSSDPLYEFQIDGLTSVDHPLQDLSCDGEFIYVLTGYGDPAVGKRFAKYTLTGEEVDRTDDLTIGKSDAVLDGVTPHYEPECVYFTYHRGRVTPALVVASGDTGARVNRVWYVGGRGTVSGRGYGSMPGFMSSGTNDFGTPNGEYIRIGGVTRTTSGSVSFQERLALSPAGNIEFGDRNNGVLTVRMSDTFPVSTLSPTIGTGVWHRVGNLVFVTFNMFNADTTGLAASNAYFSLSGSDNFSDLAVQDAMFTCLTSDHVLGSGTVNVTARLGTSGDLTLREQTDNGSNRIVDCDDLNGADIYVTGVYAV